MVYTLSHDNMNNTATQTLYYTIQIPYYMQLAHISAMVHSGSYFMYGSWACSLWMTGNFYNNHEGGRKGEREGGRVGESVREGESFDL